MSNEEKEYLEKLKTLVIKINIDAPNPEIQLLLNEVKAKCPSISEEFALEEFVYMATEYMSIREKVKDINHSEEVHEKYYSLIRWFNALHAYLSVYNTMLSLLPKLPE